MSYGLGLVNPKNRTPPNLESAGVFRGRAPKQREEEGWGYRGREVTTALNGGSSLPLIGGFLRGTSPLNYRRIKDAKVFTTRKLTDACTR